MPYFYPEVNQYFTILRDPFNLVVSMYFFAKGRSLRGEFWHRGEAVDIRDQYPNVASYVRTYPRWLFNHLPQDMTLNNYQEKLAERFVYIGVFEDLQTSINQLAEVLGKPTGELPKVNVSNYDEAVPESLRTQFYHNYPLLGRIYQFALEHYRTPNVTPAASDA